MPAADARQARGALIDGLLTDKGLNRGYIHVNNRLEGCDPLTIDAMLPRNS